MSVEFIDYDKEAEVFTDDCGFVGWIDSHGTFTMAETHISLNIEDLQEIIRKMGKIKCLEY